MTPALLNPRVKSLARGNALVLGSVAAAIALAHFPHVRPNPWIFVPALVVMAGTLDTLRNIRPRWSFYHAGVMLCLYMDLMAIFVVLFFLICPYFNLSAYLM